MPPRVQTYVNTLADWDYGMARDSEAALAYHEFLSAFHETMWRAAFEARGLDESYWPEPWVLAALPADSEFFDGDRAAVVADAMTAAVDRIKQEDWTTYGDANRRTIRHWLGGLVDGLNYPTVSVTGSGYTVNADYPTSGVSCCMISDQETDALHTVLPGGNDGSPVSDHYHDQLSLWAADEYRCADLTLTSSIR